MNIKKLNEWDEFENEVDDKIPILKTRNEMTHYVRDSDFEDFAQKCYPKLKRYCFGEIQEANNNSYYVFRPTGIIGKEQYEEVRNGFVMNNIDLFETLVKDGFLEPGTYSVRVYW